MRGWIVLIQCALVISVITRTAAEVYTAVADMEQLFGTQAALIEALQLHIGNVENHLAKLRRYLDIYSTDHEEAAKDTQNYLSNPINGYLLVKSLTYDWIRVEGLTSPNGTINKVLRQEVSKLRSSMMFPSEEDLAGAVTGLTRLQSTYRLSTSDLARGLIKGVKHTRDLSGYWSSGYVALGEVAGGTYHTGSNLSEETERTAYLADECFEIGRQSCKTEDFFYCKEWLEEAVQKHDAEEEKSIDKVEILRYLAHALYTLAEYQRALKTVNQILELKPLDEWARTTRPVYEQKVKNMKDRKTDSTAYEELCRGDSQIPTQLQAKLYCRYSHNGVPYRYLAPFKKEEANLSPEIYIYHDVLSDREIETIKEFAQPRLQRAKVRDTKTGENKFASYRISKAAWLLTKEHARLETLERRVEDMTGLTCETAEHLQVVNYGIGGHYDAHHDYTKSGKEFNPPGTGNRIATVLFYMSDVESGGATVFPDLKVYVKPIKGSAAFWYNLHKDGRPDERTLHAACPVLTGSKWVCNKWIHERGQEFRRRCGLTEDED